MDEAQKAALYRREKHAREELAQKKEQAESKERLKKNIRKKMTTIMIGALSAVEEKMGFLWGADSHEELTDGQAYVADIFQQLRSHILDIGNSQIRNAETEMDMYTIEWNKYTYTFEVKERNEE